MSLIPSASPPQRERSPERIDLNQQIEYFLRATAGVASKPPCPRQRDSGARPLTCVPPHGGGMPQSVDHRRVLHHASPKPERRSPDPAMNSTAAAAAAHVEVGVGNTAAAHFGTC